MSEPSGSGSSNGTNPIPYGSSCSEVIIKAQGERNKNEVEVVHQLHAQAKLNKELEDEIRDSMTKQMETMKRTELMIRTKNAEYEEGLAEEEKKEAEDNARLAALEQVLKTLDQQTLDEQKELDELRKRRIAKQKEMEQRRMEEDDAEILYQQALAEKKKVDEVIACLQQQPIENFGQVAAMEEDTREEERVNIVGSQESGQAIALIPVDAIPELGQNQKQQLAEQLNVQLAIEHPNEVVVAAADDIERGEAVGQAVVPAIVPEELDIPHEDDQVVAEAQNEVAVPPPQKRGRGRPPKTRPVDQNAVPAIQPQAPIDPPREDEHQDQNMEGVAEQQAEQPQKRGRGRPPKIRPVGPNALPEIAPVEDLNAPRAADHQDELVEEEEEPPRRGRGRPPKRTHPIRGESRGLERAGQPIVKRPVGRPRNDAN